MKELVVFFLVLASLEGCSLLQPRDLKDEVRSIESTSGSNPDVTPFTLEVLGEVNDGEKLLVQGRFIPKIPWDPAQVLVRLSALDAAGEQRESYFTVSDTGGVTPQTKLAADAATEFSISLPSKDITNYQLELLWGNEAAPFLKQARKGGKEGDEFLALRNLEVYRVPSDDCATPDQCVVKFTLTGQFFNAGSSMITKISLKAGFVRADELDVKNQVLENERKIEVRNLQLGPGDTKPFKLSLDKLIPVSDQIAPKPVVRIISVESDRGQKK